jgi:hypothetical protein
VFYFKKKKIEKTASGKTDDCHLHWENRSLCIAAWESREGSRANYRPSPDQDGVNYARLVKVTKDQESFKRGFYACALIFKFSSLCQKVNSCFWPIPSV